MARKEPSMPCSTAEPVDQGDHKTRFVSFYRQHRRFLIYPLGILLYLLAGYQSQAQSGAYWLTWVSFQSGGQSSNGSYTLAQVVGVPVAGTQQGGGYTLVLGLANPAATGAPTVTPTVTPSPTNTGTQPPTPTATPPSSAGDGYENDDSCAQAGGITTDGVIQQHTFHQNNDVDWVQFPVTAGVEYKITVRVPAASDLDVLVDVYDLCSGSAAATYDPAFSPEVRFKLKAATDGIFYLRLLNHNPAQTGGTAVYELSVRALTADAPTGALIIVAGRHRFNDDLQPYIHNVTNRIYQLWRSRGYAADQIYYLAVDQNLDPNQDKISDVNGMPTLPNLQNAITQWAVDKVGPDQPLTLYLVDHGEDDQFFLDNPFNAVLRPEALDQWLDQLTAARPDTPINIIIEACKSGSFITNPNSISGANRVVLTATEAYALAYGSPETQGIVFSDALLDALAQGHSLYNAFLAARDSTNRRHRDQVPWIDDDGNGTPNQSADGKLAAQRALAVTNASEENEPWAPYVAAAEVRTAVSSRREIWAKVLDDQKVKTVWAAVYPPSYTPPATGADLALGPLPTPLSERTGDWFGVDYGQLEEIGEYRIVVYAEDELGLQSQPREIRFSNGSRLWLPLVVR